MKNFARGWPSTSAYPSRDPSLCSESEFRSSIVLPMLNCTREGERKKISGVGVFPILAFCADRVKEKSVFFFFFLQKNFPDKSEPRHRISLETRLFPITTHYNVFWRAPLLKEK